MSSPVSRDDYAAEHGVNVIPQWSRDNVKRVQSACDGMYRCKHRSSGDEMLRAAAPTKIRSISQFSSGYDVKPPRPPESGMLLYVIALPILPRGNRSYKQNDNDAALISSACILCFGIPRDIRNNAPTFILFIKPFDLVALQRFLIDLQSIYAHRLTLCLYVEIYFYVTRLRQSIFLCTEIYEFPQNCTGIAQLSKSSFQFHVPI